MTRLSAGSVMPAVYAHSVQRDRRRMKAAIVLRSSAPTSSSWRCSVASLCPGGPPGFESYLDPLVEGREVGICLQLLTGGKELRS